MKIKIDTENLSNLNLHSMMDSENFEDWLCVIKEEIDDRITEHNPELDDLDITFEDIVCGILNMVRWNHEESKTAQDIFENHIAPEVVIQDRRQFQKNQ